MNVEMIMNEIEKRESIASKMDERDPIYDSTTFSLCKGMTALFVSNIICGDEYKEVCVRIYDIENDIEFYYDTTSSKKDRDIFYKYIK